MQLFITEYKKTGDTIIINNIELLAQLRKVLRASIGDSVWIQSPHHEVHKIRYELSLQAWDNKSLTWIIISEQYDTISSSTTAMIIAMPNKWDKIELIVQKLTECGLDQIVFRPSERSIIKERNDKKVERLHKIMKEAVEQSRGRNLPELLFTTNPKDIVGTHPLVVFDKQDLAHSNIPPSDHLYGLIWPEGGLTYKDYQHFAWISYDIYGLWETVLRTETAAIVGWRLIKNNTNTITKTSPTR